MSSRLLNWGLVVLLLGACVHSERSLEGREVAEPTGGWPDAGALERYDFPEGVHVLGPGVAPDRWVRPPEMEHPHDVEYAWDHSSSERKLWIRVRHELPVARNAPEARKLEVAFEELIPPDPALHGVRPLRLGLYPGLAHESLWEGMLVQRRVYVVGRSAVLIAAASNTGDPFPEAELFFCSLIFRPPLAPAANAPGNSIRFIVPASFQGTLVACRNHPWLCAGYESEEAWRRALEAARLAAELSDAVECATAEADEQPYEPGLLCGRFGVYCETN